MITRFTARKLLKSALLPRFKLFYFSTSNYSVSSLLSKKELNQSETETVLKYFSDFPVDTKESQAQLESFLARNYSQIDDAKLRTKLTFKLIESIKTQNTVESKENLVLISEAVIGNRFEFEFGDFLDLLRRFRYFAFDFGIDFDSLHTLFDYLNEGIYQDLAEGSLKIKSAYDLNVLSFIAEQEILESYEIPDECFHQIVDWLGTVSLEEARKIDIDSLILIFFFICGNEEKPFSSSSSISRILMESLKNILENLDQAEEKSILKGNFTYVTDFLFSFVLAEEKQIPPEIERKLGEIILEEDDFEDGERKEERVNTILKIGSRFKSLDKDFWQTAENICLDYFENTLWTYLVEVLEEQEGSPPSLSQTYRVRTIKVSIQQFYGKFLVFLSNSKVFSLEKWKRTVDKMSNNCVSRDHLEFLRWYSKDIYDNAGKEAWNYLIGALPKETQTILEDERMVKFVLKGPSKENPTDTAEIKDIIEQIVGKADSERKIRVLAAIVSFFNLNFKETSDLNDLWSDLSAKFLGECKDPVEFETIFKENNLGLDFRLNWMTPLKGK